MTQVLVSAGHFPAAPGAKFEDFVEHTEAVLWMNHVVDLLDQTGVVEVDRVPVGSLRPKVEFINRADPELAIEIHFNDFLKWIDQNGDNAVDPGEMFHSGKGCETLYYPNSTNGLRLAGYIQSHLATVFPPNRGAVEGYYRRNPAKGVDFFLRRTNCTSVIVEPEFVANAAKIRQLRMEGCQAIVGGVLDYLNAK